MIFDKYSIVCDSADYKWCSRKGGFCHKDSFGFECKECNWR